MKEITPLERRLNIANNKQEVIDAIKNYIKERGGNYSAWCIGRVKNPYDICSSMQNVDSYFWVYRQVSSGVIAKQVVAFFTDILGMAGDLRDLDNDHNIVYVYKKASNTTNTK